MCEEAVKVLKVMIAINPRVVKENPHSTLPQNSKRKSVRAVLYVHGDGLRVVDDDTKGLIVDQTIEKVRSFVWIIFKDDPHPLRLSLAGLLLCS